MCAPTQKSCAPCALVVNSVGQLYFLKLRLQIIYARVLKVRGHDFYVHQFENRVHEFKSRTHELKRPGRQFYSHTNEYVHVLWH